MRSPLTIPPRFPPTPECTAYHEAGHAVFAYAFRREFGPVTIVPANDGTFGGLDLPTNPALPDRYDGASAQQRKIEEYMMIILAGAAGEHLKAVLAGDAEEDEGKTWEAECRQNELVGKDGGCLRQMAKMVALSEIEANAYCEWLFRRTKAIIVLLGWKHAVRDLATELLDKKTLQPDAVVACIEKDKATLRGPIKPGVSGA